jgi:hypothetical protein
MHGDAEAVRTTRALTDDRHIAQGHVVEHALAHGRDLVRDGSVGNLVFGSGG